MEARGETESSTPATPAVAPSPLASNDAAVVDVTAPCTAKPASTTGADSPTGEVPTSGTENVQAVPDSAEASEVDSLDACSAAWTDDEPAPGDTPGPPSAKLSLAGRVPPGGRCRPENEALPALYERLNGDHRLRTDRSEERRRQAFVQRELELEETLKASKALPKKTIEELDAIFERLHAEASARKERRKVSVKEQAADYAAANTPSPRRTSRPTRQSLTQDNRRRWQRLYDSGMEKIRAKARVEQENVGTEPASTTMHVSDMEEICQRLHRRSDRLQRIMEEHQERELWLRDNVSVHRGSPREAGSRSARRLYKDAVIRQQRRHSYSAPSSPSSSRRPSCSVASSPVSCQVGESPRFQQLFELAARQKQVRDERPERQAAQELAMLQAASVHKAKSHQGFSVDEAFWRVGRPKKNLRGTHYGRLASRLHAELVASTSREDCCSSESPASTTFTASTAASPELRRSSFEAYSLPGSPAVSSSFSMVAQGSPTPASPDVFNTFWMRRSSMEAGQRCGLGRARFAALAKARVEADLAAAGVDDAGDGAERPEAGSASEAPSSPARSRMPSEAEDPQKAAAPPSDGGNAAERTLSPQRRRASFAASASSSSSPRRRSRTEEEGGGATEADSAGDRESSPEVRSVVEEADSADGVSSEESASDDDSDDDGIERCERCGAVCPYGERCTTCLVSRRCVTGGASLQEGSDAKDAASWLAKIARRHPDPHEEALETAVVVHWASWEPSPIHGVWMHEETCVLHIGVEGDELVCGRPVVCRSGHCLHLDKWPVGASLRCKSCHERWAQGEWREAYNHAVLDASEMLLRRKRLDQRNRRRDFLQAQAAAVAGEAASGSEEERRGRLATADTVASNAVSRQTSASASRKIGAKAPSKKPQKHHRRHQSTLLAVQQAFHKDGSKLIFTRRRAMITSHHGLPPKVLMRVKESAEEDMQSEDEELPIAKASEGKRAKPKAKGKSKALKSASPAKGDEDLRKKDTLKASAKAKGLGKKKASEKQSPKQLARKQLRSKAPTRVSASEPN